MAQAENPSSNSRRVPSNEQSTNFAWFLATWALVRIAEVVKTDMKVENGKVNKYRTRVLLSFKYEG